jgi:hypothetical protein
MKQGRQNNQHCRNKKWTQTQGQILIFFCLIYIYLFIYLFIYGDTRPKGEESAVEKLELVCISKEVLVTNVTLQHGKLSTASAREIRDRLFALRQDHDDDDDDNESQN